MGKLTDAYLKGACRRQRALFRKEWPDGAPLTLESLRRADELELDIGWLVGRAPTHLLDAYEAAEKPLWDAYVAARRPIILKLLKAWVKEGK